MGVVSKSQNAGVFGRGLRLGKLGFSLVGSYVGYQAQNFLLGEDSRADRQEPSRNTSPCPLAKIET